MKKEASMVRLLSIYWKTASLAAISILLLTNQNQIGYLTSFIAPILMVGSTWFWIDLNEELAEFPKWKPLAITIRIWRWALTFFGFLSLTLSYKSLSCFASIQSANCEYWLEAPQSLHNVLTKLFSFLFGANWTEPIATFVGFLALTAYIIGVLQWIIIRLIRHGRVAGGF